MARFVRSVNAREKDGYISTQWGVITYEKYCKLEADRRKSGARVKYLDGGLVCIEQPKIKFPPVKTLSSVKVCRFSGVCV